MKKYLLLIISIILLLAVAGFFYLNQPAKKEPVETNVIKNNNAISSVVEEKNISLSTEASAQNFLPPLDRAKERVTKKPFGIFITPQTSPVQPERFRGYHTGVDFEVFPEEIDKDVTVKAVCSGKVLVKRRASGYGGVLVQSCNLDNNDITVLYGHLNLNSIVLKVGDKIKAGAEIGFLGKNKSTETDSERKHLHLSFHKGAEVDIRGYVQQQDELVNWIDPCLYVCGDMIRKTNK